MEREAFVYKATKKEEIVNLVKPKIKKSNLVLAIYSDERTVFRLKDIAMLTGESAFSLSVKNIYF